MEHLSPEEIARLASGTSPNGARDLPHLDVCDACRREYLLERALRKAIGEESPLTPLSARFEERVLAAIARTTGTDRAFSVLRVLGLAFPMVLVLVVVFLALTMSAAGGSPGSAEPSGEPLRALLSGLQSALSAAGTYADVLRIHLVKHLPLSMMGLATTILLSVLALVLADRVLERRLGGSRW